MKQIKEIQGYELDHLDPNEIKRVLVGFSDVHGNLEAWNAFVQEVNNIKEQFPNAFFNAIGLGDYIDYGPDSVQVLERIVEEFHADQLLAGNHDMLIYDLVNDTFGKDSKTTNISSHFKRLKGTRGRISAMLVVDQIKESPNAMSILSMICNSSLVRYRSNADYNLYCCHGSIDDVLWGDGMEITANQLDDLFINANPTIMLCGHTHIPGIKMIDDKNAIVNVGSIGQPRDGNPFGCFATIYETADILYVNFHRFAYNYKRTIEKMKLNMPQQHPYYGERLLEGK